MKAEERAELRRMINTLFESGPNKTGLFEALEQFIDRNYIYRQGPLQGLIKSMEMYVSYTDWKKKFIGEIKSELNR